MVNLSMMADDFGDANEVQAKHSLTVEAFANSVIAQPNIQYDEELNLSKYEHDLNTTLINAKVLANHYINSIQPSIIENIGNISNYYAIHSAVATQLPKGSTQSQWIESLRILQNTSLNYYNKALGIESSLKKFHENISDLSIAFEDSASHINIALNGDKGLLKTYEDKISAISAKLDKIEISGFSFAFITVAAFITALYFARFYKGTLTRPKLFIGGFALFSVTGTLVGLASSYFAYRQKRNDMINEENRIQFEVKYTSLLATSYKGFVRKTEYAITAASQMQSAWHSLNRNLHKVVNDLNLGVASPDKVRFNYLHAVDTSIKKLINNTKLIKEKMSGLTTIKPDLNQSENGIMHDVIHSAGI